MQVGFYKCADDPRKITKSPQLIYTAQCTPYEGVDITAPTIIVEYNSNIVGCNYAHIPELGRWYFINKISLETAKSVVVNLAVDVLYTYRETILNWDLYIVRSESESNTKLVDSEYIFESDYTVSTYYLDYGNIFRTNFEGIHCILLTVF